jgi:hypothetical protein
MHFKLTIKRSGDGMNADPVLALNSQAGPRWTRGPWSPLAVPIALILLVAATFAIIRSQTNLVFDDTPGLASEIYDNGDPPRPEGVRLYTMIV